jgi:hypothetical protein
VERTTIAGETEELGENLPERHFVPPQIPHDQVRFWIPDRSGGKPATNRLSYGAAKYWVSSLKSTIASSTSFPVDHPHIKRCVLCAADTSLNKIRNSNE